MAGWHPHTRSSQALLTADRRPRDIQRILFPQEQFHNDVTTVYERRVKGWWKLLLDVLDGIELQSPSNRGRRAGLFYIVHTASQIPTCKWQCYIMTVLLSICECPSLQRLSTYA